MGREPPMQRYVLDRFEGKFAVLEAAGGGMRNLPREKLPEGCREGDVFNEENGVFTRDDEETRRRAEKISRLTKGLLG